MSADPIDDRGDLGRIPPQDVAAEQSVLGAMMMSKDAIADVVETIKGRDFYRPAHEMIYSAIIELYGRGEPADAVTVADQLGKTGELTRAGGHIYLVDLISSVAIAANAGYYAEIVHEKAVLRRLVDASIKIAQLGYQGTGDVTDIVDAAEQAVYEVSEGRTSDDYKPLSVLIEPTIDEMEAIASRSGMAGVPTGFAELDELTNGLHSGQMIIVAARPAVGKALALDTPLPTPTGWTTMGQVQVGDRLLGADGRPTTVVAATDVMAERPCYRITFDGSTTVVADAEHQWPQPGLPVTTTGQLVPGQTIGTTGQQFTVGQIEPVESVPVRCVQVDNPDHLYLCTRSMVPTHNSTLALDFARAAAIKNKMTTAFFSLEMSQTEIVMRLLSAEAQVALNHIRNGKMTDDDWQRVVAKTMQVSEAPLFIDDSPNLTMMEIRAKARRLKQRNDLKMVIIDYMQLMTSGKKVESRQLEVSEFSRQIKLLAKELEIPVIALSQLNRGPEQRTDKKPMLSDLRESGCLTGDTRVLRADTGAETTMGELLATGATHTLVWSLDQHGLMVARPMTHVFSSGVKDVFRLRLASGREVKASANHPFLTIDGWKPLGDLAAGVRIAIPRTVPEPLHPVPMDADELLSAALETTDHVPAPVFAAPNPQVRSYLEALGVLTEAGLASFPTPTRKLADQLAQLLLRLGILAQITPSNGGLAVEPQSVDELQQVAHEARHGQMVSFAQPDGHTTTALLIAEDELATHRRRDIHWDTIDSIDPLGAQEVFDATVEGTHNFIADGIAVHNSLEQDADMVILLHREDVYDKESPRAGEADLIVAKHRNGPTATITTAFQGHYSRFVDMHH